MGTHLWRHFLYANCATKSRVRRVDLRSFPTEKPVAGEAHCTAILRQDESERRGRTGIEECVIVLKQTELRHARCRRRRHRRLSCGMCERQPTDAEHKRRGQVSFLSSRS